MKTKIAFICVHNSCRSQMAEAFGKVYLSEKYDCYSAGTETKPEIKTEAKAPAKATKAAKTAKETKPAKSSAAKTTASRAKKNVVETFIQFQGCEVSQEVIIERVKEQYVADGHKATEVKEVKLYIKPEDRAAYYVINDEYAGKVDLF